MSFLQPLLLAALPLIGLPVLIHLINQWRYQTKPWGAMQFLLKANRMNRGMAKLRQWLILLLRTLAVAGLILAVARPLSSGLLGWSGSGKTDTTIVLFDRSPSMQAQGIGGQTKLESGRQQLESALSTLGSNHWVAIDSTTAKPQVFETIEGMFDGGAFDPSSASASIPKMLEASLDYLKNNSPGSTEIWICSDLAASDWNTEDGAWALLREQFESLPQSVRFQLVAYPQVPQSDFAIRVTEVRRAPEVMLEDEASASNSTLNDGGKASSNRGGVVSATGPELLISFQVTRTNGEVDSQTDAVEAAADQGTQSTRSTPISSPSNNTASGIPASKLPVLISLEGARSETIIEITGEQTEILDFRIPMPLNVDRGWGRVSIPADANNADNDFYFVFDEPEQRKVVVVTENRTATRVLEIAAGITPEGDDTTVVEVLAPNQIDSPILEESALVIWQAELPSPEITPTLDRYLSAGGQVMFFPPSQLRERGGLPASRVYRGVQWESWNQADSKVAVTNWRGDQDLLASTNSGGGLPVGDLQIGGYANLVSKEPLTKLASLDGGAALLARLPSDKGGVYFCSTSASPDDSSLAESGIVLFVIVQRAIEQGQSALGKTTDRVAQTSDELAEQASEFWRQIAGDSDVLSVEYPVQAGVYAADDMLFAVNRPVEEDRVSRVDDDRLAALFDGLQFSRVNGEAGQLSGIVREVWRAFLILMIIALLLEALLCIPKTARKSSAMASGLRQGFAGGDA